MVVEAFVDGGYFDVLGISIVAGRNFMPKDRNRDVVLVNETFARSAWPVTGSVMSPLDRGPAASNARPPFST